MEATKWLKPSISVSRVGDSASVQGRKQISHADFFPPCAFSLPTTSRGLVPRDDATRLGPHESPHFQMVP
jgi:hypothetical protein